MRRKLYGFIQQTNILAVFLVLKYRISKVDIAYSSDQFPLAMTLDIIAALTLAALAEELICIIKPRLYKPGCGSVVSAFVLIPILSN